MLETIAFVETKKDYYINVVVSESSDILKDKIEKEKFRLKMHELLEDLPLEKEDVIPDQNNEVTKHYNICFGVFRGTSTYKTLYIVRAEGAAKNQRSVVKGSMQPLNPSSEVIKKIRLI